MSRLDKPPCPLPVSPGCSPPCVGATVSLLCLPPGPAGDRGLNPCVMVPGFGPLMGGQTCQWAVGSGQPGEKRCLCQHLSPILVSLHQLCWELGGEAPPHPLPRATGHCTAPGLQGWTCRSQGLVAAQGPEAEPGGGAAHPLSPWSREALGTKGPWSWGPFSFLWL